MEIKYCVECKYYKYVPGMYCFSFNLEPKHLCTHDLARDLVTKQANTDCQEIRDGICGKEAILFEPKENINNLPEPDNDLKDVQK